jgi:hypothetical protein
MQSEEFKHKITTTKKRYHIFSEKDYDYEALPPPKRPFGKNNFKFDE